MALGASDWPSDVDIKSYQQPACVEARTERQCELIGSTTNDLYRAAGAAIVVAIQALQEERPRIITDFGAVSVPFSGSTSLDADECHERDGAA
jgi:hypothetical protein